MGGGGKGGSADSSGMAMAAASAQEAQLAYSLGSQQLQWAKDEFNQEQPLVNEAEQTQIDLGQQDLQFAGEEENNYNQIYAPLESSFVDQAENWASPANTALVQGQAQDSVAEQSNQELAASQEQLRSYGIDPSSPKYAGLTIGANAIAGAGEAAAGTTAAQNLKLQQLGLESQAINTGRGLVNSTSQLGSTGASAASGAANTAESNLQTGSNAMSAPSQMINAGTNAMNSYVNAVNGYNQAQLGYSQLNANTGMSELSGLGSAAGGILGLLAKGGGVTRLANGGDPSGKGAKPTAIPVPHGGTPGGSVPISASPSGGSAVDDVDAKLTAGEFVIPKDVAMWKGHEHFVKQIDQARMGQHELSQRNDIGGEKVSAIPNPNPPFRSQPFNAHAHNAANARQATMPPPSMHPAHVSAQMGRPQSAIPMRAN